MSYTTGTRSQGPQPGRGRPIPQNQGTGGQSRQAGGAMMATSPHMYNQPAAAMFLSSPGAQHLPPYPGSQMNFPSPLYILQTNNPAPNANQVYYQPQIPNPQLTGPSQQQQPGRPPSNPALIPAPPNIIQQQTPPNNFNNENMAAMQQPQYPQQMRGVPAAQVVPSPSDSELMPPPATPGSSAPSTPMRSTPVPSTPDVKENTPVSTPPPLKGSKSMGADPAVMNKKPAAVKSQDTEGKTKTYSREFLMSLQNSALSKTKPDALGSSSILQEIMSTGRGPIPDARRDFNPDYFKPASPKVEPPRVTNVSYLNQSPRSSMHKRASVGRDKNMGPSQSMTRSHAKEITYKREEVKLTKAANAWKPGDVGANVSEEEKNHLALLKSFRGILNKITPSTFAKLLNKILALPVKTEKDLQEMVILVFDKARNEPMFCMVYTTLCQGIAKVQIEATGSEVNFCKLLLVRCRHEFERLAEDDSAMAKRAEQVKEAKTPEEAAKLEEELKAFQTKARHRKLGYMRFIGELFLLQMLTPKIMHECIINLLKAADEKSLEYLCRLWTMIGKVFDVGDKAKEYNDQYFNQMKKIANGQSRNVCLRVRFALQDVIDLRENNWVPRSDKNVPKTLKEIEAQATQAMLEKPLPTRSSQGHAPPAPRSRHDERDGAGWSHVKTGSQRVDPTKLRLTKQSILGGDGEVQLGPAKGFGGSWGRGSSGSGKNTPSLQPEEGEEEIQDDMVVDVSKVPDFIVSSSHPNPRTVHSKVVLKRSDNPWKAGCWCEGLSEEEKTNTNICRRFRAALNKITPTTFATVLREIQQLVVRSKKHLQELVDIMLDKVRRDSLFAKIYATLCQQIAKEFKVHREGSETELTFLEMLIPRCHQELASISTDDNRMVKINEQIYKTKIPEEKRKLGEFYRNLQTKARHHRLGLIRFVGELYLLGMFTVKSIRKHTHNFLSIDGEDSLEYLCVLWTTIGKKCDADHPAKVHNDQYFDQMKKIANGQSRNVCLRIRFALQDVIDLRENKWVPRDLDGPVTLQELHAQTQEQDVNQLISEY